MNCRVRKDLGTVEVTDNKFNNITFVFYDDNSKVPEEVKKAHELNKRVLKEMMQKIREEEQV